MTKEPIEIDRLFLELKAVQLKLYDEMDAISNSWNFHLGPLRARGRFSAMRFAQIYAIFNIVLFVLGVALTLLRGTERELGVAIVVGVIFSLGSFLAQLWGKAMERQYEVIDSVLNKDARLAKLREMRESELALIDEIERNRVDDSDDATSG